MNKIGNVIFALLQITQLKLIRTVVISWKYYARFMIAKIKLLIVTLSEATTIELKKCNMKPI